MESFWICDECLLVVAYADCSPRSLYVTADGVHHHMARLHQGLLALLPLSADFDVDTGLGIQPSSTSPCNACGNSAHGDRHRFTQL